MRDYYETLGVPKKATKEEIKRAYRKLAHQYHPDKSGGDEKKFKEINEAYQVLGDNTKKVQYDQFGPQFDFSKGAGFSGFQGFDFSDFSNAKNSSSFDFNDIFSEFFGGGVRASTKTRPRGRDIHMDIIISLEEAYSGVEREIALQKYVICDRCRGRKNEPDTQLKKCETCKGSGEIRHEQHIIFGSFTRIVQCKECAGLGSIPEMKCTKCKGTGRIQDAEKIQIKIPPGINSGEAIEFAGKGEVGESGQAGDLYAEVYIKEHPQFRRKNDDIFSDIGVSMSQAALGDDILAKTLGGEERINVPSGSQSHDVIKLQAKGMPHLQGVGRGDHYVRIVIRTPKRLSKRAQELLKQLRDEGL